MAIWKFFIDQYLQYFGLALLLLACLFFNKQYRKEQLLFYLSFFAFIFPLACLGKIIYPRFYYRQIFF
jgi:cytochrome bd-type quinol oxidase subunit 2